MMRSLVLILCVLAFGAQAEVYKWKDASGKMVYSDQPPPEAKGKAKPMNLKEASVTTVAAPKPIDATSTSPASAVKPLAAASAPPLEKPRDEQACAEAEKRLAFLKGANLYKQISNDKGETEYLPFEKKEKEIKEKTAYIKENCR